mmetsp:Transcript_1416/g.3581  ORF Transcript_1416/g.3581 Transcript_1416/m.3581 type:complete len:117 (+) Transcript_1416:1256-1606(+)
MCPIAWMGRSRRRRRGQGSPIADVGSRGGELTPPHMNRNARGGGTVVYITLHDATYIHRIWENAMSIIIVLLCFQRHGIDYLWTYISRGKISKCYVCDLAGGYIFAGVQYVMPPLF